MVETQFRAATARLTASIADQAILENVLEESKPRMPVECDGLHFLLATPFRYAPYPHGSRFRRAGQAEGVFYASEEVPTAVAEVAFLRLLFLAEAPTARPPSRAVEHTVFGVACASENAIDLRRAPLVRDSAAWTHRNDYAACQALADVARRAGIEAIRYQSVRDPQRRANAAVLSPAVFAEPVPRAFQSWHVVPARHSVRAWCESPRLEIEFALADFAADARLAPLAVGAG